MADSLEGYKFTPEQERSIGDLAVQHWGCRLTTSWGINAIPYVIVARSPRDIKTFDIYPDGTVVGG